MNKPLPILLILLSVYFAATQGFDASRESNPGLTLDSHSSKCFQKPFAVEAGKVELTFNYRITNIPSLKESYVVVSIDGVQIYRLYPAENGRTIKLSGELTAGEHLLAYCAVGSVSETPHQAFISAIVLTANQCISGWGRDIIVNGGFEQTECKSNWCIYTQHILKTKPKSVVGWSSEGSLEVGRNFFYQRPSLGSGYVAYVQSVGKSFPEQEIDLKAGKYLLSFEWAPRNRFFNGEPSFQVKVNGVTVKNFKLTDDTVRRESIEFNVERDNPDAQIEFIEDLNHANSPLIDNVRLQRFEDCLEKRFTPL